MVMQKLKEDGSEKRMFNHIKRLMRKHEQKDTRIKIVSGSEITVSDEQEVVKEVERFWGNFFVHKWESDTITEKVDDWKGYDK